jgi:hypothetical protein
MSSSALKEQATGWQGTLPNWGRHGQQSAMLEHAAYIVPEIDHFHQISYR